MYDGVLFQTPEFRSESPDDTKTYRMAICVGSLTKDPHVSMIGSQQTPKVAFNIKYHTKSYMNVAVWGKNDMAYASQTLEKGDMVLCFGTVTHSTYVAKSGPHKGEKREWYEMNCQWICAMSWLTEMLPIILSHKIREIVESEESDAMESAEDHADEYEVDGYDADTEYDDDYEVTI